MWGTGIRRSAGALLAMAMLWGCSGGGGGTGSTSGTASDGGGDPAERETVVAKLEMVAPQADEFLVRATLPVPEGTYVPAQGDLEPLVLITWPGKTAATQVEPVTWYPDPADGASVVEVIGRIRRSPKVAPGQTLPIYVARVPHGEGKMVMRREVKRMLGKPGTLTLATQDVYGNAYTADLFAQVLAKDPRARQLRSGGMATEYAVHEVLSPVQPKTGSKATLDHLMGVHAYITTFDDASWFLLDLHVHNGMDGLDGGTLDDTALDELFFRDLVLRLPEGWKASTLFDHPSQGSGGPKDGGWALPLIRKQSSGKLHYMPKQGRLVRRVAVWTGEGQGEAESMLRGERQAYCRPGTAPSGEQLWSWWNSATARWFPQAHRLPRLDHLAQGSLEAEVLGDWQTYSGQLASGQGGSYPYISDAMGWAQPWGVAYGGMSGGDEINLTDGFAELTVGRPEGYRLAQLRLRAYLDRQPTALFGSDGTPTRVEDLMVLEGYGAPYFNGTFYITPGSASDPYGFDDAPTHQIQAAEAQGLVPGYRDLLKDWMPIDIQHYIRMTRNLKLMTWLANDSLAKDQLLAAAEVFRLGFHSHLNSAYGHVQSTGLRARMDHVAEHPGRGVDLSRAEGWGVDVSLAAYLVGDEETRARMYPWFETIAQLAEDGASTCSGNIMSSYMGTKLFDGKYRIRYLGHSSYADNALRGIQRSVFQGRDEARASTLGELLVGNARALCTPPFWNEEAGQPWNYVGVSPADASEGEFCFDLPGDALGSYTTNQKYYASLAYAYEETGDELFLFRASQMLGGGDLRTLLEEEGTDNLVTFSPLLATVQETPEP